MCLSALKAKPMCPLCLLLQVTSGEIRSSYNSKASSVCLEHMSLSPALEGAPDALYVHFLAQQMLPGALTDRSSLFFEELSTAIRWSMCPCPLYGGILQSGRERGPSPIQTAVSTATRLWAS